MPAVLAARAIVTTARPAAAGQGLVEYGLILALTSGLTVLWLTVFGGAVADALTVIGEAIDQATGG
jgi:Flp pilus assembly pilin Flp